MLTEAEAEVFQELVDKDELYSVRVEVGGRVMLTSMPARMLKAAGFQEEFTIFLGQEGDVQAVNYRVGQQDGARLVESGRIVLNTQGVIGETIVGVSPMMEYTTQQIPSHDVPRPPEQTSTEPQQSFLSKYWYVLVPMALLMVLSGGGGAESEQKTKRTKPE